jgi:hypothetical protein
VCTTLNFFNIWNIGELAYKVKEWSPDFWHINILHHPVEFDIQQIPMDIKQQIIATLEKIVLYKEEIQTAIDYIKGEPDYNLDNWKQALTKKIKSIDAVRKENFADSFTALNNLLKIYD